MACTIMRYHGPASKTYYLQLESVYLYPYNVLDVLDGRFFVLEPLV